MECKLYIIPIYYLYYTIYYTKCQKNTVSFQHRLKNDRKKDIKNSTGILLCKDFHEEGCNFNRYSKFIIILKFANGQKQYTYYENAPKRKTFCIRKLKTLSSLRLNQELSKWRQSSFSLLFIHHRTLITSQSNI